MTTALYLLRCVQTGLHISDLDALSVGMVLDVLTESSNDGYDYREVASQRDFDKF